MGKLSAAQFAGKVNAGGASRMLLSHEEQVPGKNLYSVGMPGHEVQLAHPIVRQQVHAHEQQMLADPTIASDPEVMQGGWKKHSDVFLDASRQVEGRKEAVALGRQNKQIAVYDTSHDRDIYMKPPTVKPTERVRGSRQTGYRVKTRRP